MAGKVVAIGDRDARSIGVLYKKARGSVTETARCLLETGRALLEKKASMSHGEWMPWLTDNADVLGFEDRTARRLTRLAIDKVDASVPLTNEEATEIVNAIWGHGGSQLNQQSLSNEHYTPAKYIEAVRSVLGEIDLDPASCEEANRVVKATVFFTKDDDGLAKEWVGRVWLNPPYGDEVGKFIAKLTSEINAGNVDAAVVLVNAHCTDTIWFQPLWDGCQCFTNHRINFTGDDERSGSTHGSVFVYFGPNESAFVRHFTQFGPVVARIE
jgi:phage N-6-adenine-methyltransferase